MALEEGQTQREATALLGEPLSARIQDGYTLLIYEDGEVRIENGVVVSWTR